MLTASIQSLGAQEELEKKNKKMDELHAGQILLLVRSNQQDCCTFIGAAEPLALDQAMKPVLDMHCQVTEERVCEGPLDYVTR